MAISQLGQHDQIAEAEINPLLICKDRIVMVDGLIRITFETQSNEQHQLTCIMTQPVRLITKKNQIFSISFCPC